MNVWRSRGAGRRQPTLGLRDVSLVLPDADALAAAVDRLTGIQQVGEQAFATEDPWGNQLTLSV